VIDALLLNGAAMPENRSSRNRTDPMREIDLLVLEDLMMRRNFEINRTAVAAQTACLTLVGLSFFAAFFYALTHRESVEAVLADPSHRTEAGWISAHSGEGERNLRGKAGGR
jgi:hypothetical protein